MTVDVLRPNSTIASYNLSLIGGATCQAILSDDSDASYVAPASDGTFTLGMGDFTLPAGNVIKSGKLRLRVARSSAGTTLKTFKCSGGALLPSTVPVINWTSPTTVTVGANFTNPTDASLDAATLETLGVVVDNALRIYEAYMDVVHVAKPAPTLTYPTGAITNTNLPQTQWVHTLDADGGAQTHYQVKHFTAAQYGIGGFSPDTSPNSLDSGIVVSASTVHTPTTPLVDDTYRSYLRIAQTVNGVQHWSSWVFSGYTLSVSLPVPPQLVVLADSAKARIRIDIDRVLGPAIPDFFELERSFDGLTWGSVRQLDSGVLVPDGSGNLFPDYDLENFPGGWTAYQGTLAQEVTVVKYGMISYKITCGAFTTCSIILNPSNALGRAIITPGQEYTFSAWVRAGTTVRSATIQSRYANSAGTLLAGPSPNVWNYHTGQPTPLSLTDWTLFTLTGIAPPLAVTTGIVINFLSTVNGEVFYVDGEQIVQGNEKAPTDGKRLYDYETGNGQLASYRAKSLHNYGSAPYAASPWSTVQSATWST